MAGPTPEDADAIARRAVAVLILLRNRGLTVLESTDVLCAALLLLHEEEERPAVREEMTETVQNLGGLLQTRSTSRI